MKGWNGRFLRVDLTKGKLIRQEYPEDLAKRFMGGRGFAVKLLWDELEPGTDPLGPENILIFAVGPYTGFNVPNSGKMVVAAKSPLTGGYGDGNLGTMASPNMRKAGLDAIIVTGKAKKPSYLWVEDDEAEIVDASDLWGLDSYEAERRLKKKHGAASGALLIGPSGENLCRIATIVSQEGRAGGRPGIGAVMGSKNLKAVVIHGTKELQAADKPALDKLGKEGFQSILKRDNYKHWKAQGTMATVEWCQAAGTLPTRNFSEGVFEHSKEIDGNTMEAQTIKQRGCPNCNMTCGNVILDTNGEESELDYENVVMLGSNIGVGDLKQVGRLNRMCDMLGLDTISAGSAVAFAMEASEKKLVKGLNLKWGDFEGAQKMLEDMAYMRDQGATFGLGVKKAAEKIGEGSSRLGDAREGAGVQRLRLPPLPRDEPKLRHLADRRPPQGRVGHQLGDKQRHPRGVRPREGGQGDRVPADQGRHVRVPRRMQVPVDRARLRDRLVSQVLRGCDGRQDDPRRHVGSRRPHIRPHQGLLGP